MPGFFLVWVIHPKMAWAKRPFPHPISANNPSQMGRQSHAQKSDLDPIVSPCLSIYTESRNK
jgi:hypothetical protein